MASRKVSPRSIVLDLLRVARGSAPVSGLIDVGEMFGFTGNAVRVAVTRLVSAGLVESDERGWYRLAPLTDPVNEWVEWWRQGERRVRSWSGEWVTLLLPKGARSTRKVSERWLTRLGLAEAMPGVWVRPDNLAGDLDRLRARLHGLGVQRDATLFVAQGVDDQTADRWAQLWPVAALTTAHEKLRRDLERSQERLERMPRPQAMVESFLLGGDAIRALARDPLLPEEIMCGDARRALTAAMRRYDQHGRRIWRRALDVERLERAPSHLAVVQGGLE